MEKIHILGICIIFIFFSFYYFCDKKSFKIKMTNKKNKELSPLKKLIKKFNKLQKDYLKTKNYDNESLTDSDISDDSDNEQS